MIFTENWFGRMPYSREQKTCLEECLTPENDCLGACAQHSTSTFCRHLGWFNVSTVTLYAWYLLPVYDYIIMAAWHSFSTAVLCLWDLYV